MGEETLVRPEWYLASGALLFLLSLILFVIVWIRLGRLNKRYKAMLNGKSGTDYEELLIQIQTTLKELGNKADTNDEAIHLIRERMKEQKAHVEVVRYNAFEQGGNEMSFSLAIVNDYMDGVVISGLHTREQTYMYVKPLDRGQSKYQLSTEEKKALEQAMSKARS